MFGKSKTIRLALAAGLVMMASSSWAQKVSGTVKDANGDPVIGATVMESGTQNGTITDLDGNFTLDLKNGGSLNVSYVGMKPQTIATNGKSSFEVKLEDDATTLNDVVVVGYGTMKKKDLTGSVASVKMEDIGKVAGANVLQAIQASVPGIDVMQADGQAGSGLGTMTMRGNRSLLAENSPLIIVDGVEYGSTLDIPASEIESMDILKDAASTAIYGTKGANGVIIITTKRGKAGKTNVNLNAYWSFNSPTGVVKPMTGDKEVQRLIDAQNYKTAAQNNWDFSTGNATAESILGSAEWNDTKLIDIVNSGSYVDWLDLILQNSTSQNYEVSVNGGNQKTNFNVAFSLMDDRGLMKNDQFKRYTGRANIDHEINKIFKVGANLSFAYKDNDKRNGGVYNQALKMTSITRAIADDGTYYPLSSYFYQSHVNPLLDEVEGAYQRNIETTRFFGGAYLQITPFKGFMWKTSFNLDRSQVRDGLYQDMDSQSMYQSTHSSAISNTKESTTKYVMQNIANYNVDFNDIHNLGVMVGNEVSHNVRENTVISGDAGAEHYYNSSFYDVGRIGSPTAISSYIKSSMVSFFGRVNYTLMDRYLFQATLRTDGSSMLADGHKWGTFPSFSAGWRISEEAFMAGTKSWLDNLKLRLSWGLSGNAAVAAYQTLATVDAITVNSNYKAPMTLGNENLTWETTSAVDLGLDFSILNGRLNGGIDFYWTRTRDLLWYATAPPSSVYTTVIDNVGKTKGNGVEISLNALPVKTKDFEWNVNASATFSRDEVVELSNGKPYYRTSDGNGTLTVGEPVSAYYQYEVDGCWNIGEFEKYVNDNYTSQGKEFTKPYPNYGNPGTSKVVDQNGDGIIDDSDKIIYNRSPKAVLGMTNTFSYKGFSLSIQMMARLGGYMMYQGYGLYTYDNSNWGDLSYWTPNNTGAIIPTPGDDTSATTAYKAAIQMQKADFFKIKDITLAYQFDKNLLQKIHLNSARVYCSLKNFITSSKIDNYDSERGGAVTFPLRKQVVLGLNVTF